MTSRAENAEPDPHTGDEHPPHLAHHFDTPRQQFQAGKLGAINTGILITSSLTMAWGVRCAQRNQQRGLVACLALTLVFAFGFLGIKYLEYKQKWEHKLLWGSEYDPSEHVLQETDQREAE